MVKQFMNVKDVMAVTGASESYSYGLIRRLNKELSEKGYFTIPGKVSKVYFEEKVYGVHAE